MPTYNQRLTANNQKIDDITALANTLPDAGEIEEKIDAQDEIIENLKSALDEKAGLGGGTPNIFVQIDEPDKKKGIWLKKEATPGHYTYDEEVFISGEWMDDGTHANIPFSFTNGSVISVGTDIYMFGGDYTKAYKYDTLTNTYTQLSNIPFSYAFGQIANIGNYIYLFSSNSSSYKRTAYKYDIVTDTYTEISSLPYNSTTGSAVSIGTDIYIFGGEDNSKYDYTKAYKYDTLTDTYTRLADTTTVISYTKAVALGASIYLFGAVNRSFIPYVYKYDIAKNSYTRVTSLPSSEIGVAGATCVGENVYIFSNTNVVYKYNTLTDTYTQLANIPYSLSYSGPNISAIVGNMIYLMGPGYNGHVQVYSLESKTYQQDELVVINQGQYKSVGYEIELYNNNKDVTSPKYAFADAWYYTIQGGLETNISTYYGDGTRWINIKNPVNNGGGN